MNDIQAGDQVRFTNTNGYAFERESACKKLIPNVTYICTFVDEGGWRTEIKLKGIDDWFNSVMFEKVP